MLLLGRILFAACLLFGVACNRAGAAESAIKLLGCWTEKTVNTLLTLCFKHNGRLFGIGIGENGLGGDFEGRWKSFNQILTISGVDQHIQRCSFELLEGPKLLRLSGCKEAGTFGWDRADFNDSTK
jgi:hypothetical protein